MYMNAHRNINIINSVNNNTMNRLMNTWNKANTLDKLGLILFTMILTLLGNVVVAWANNGFATYF